MRYNDLVFSASVNCRIGSLESFCDKFREQHKVNCRIGSLESIDHTVATDGNVNCRIGSLETVSLLIHP